MGSRAQKRATVLMDRGREAEELRKGIEKILEEDVGDGPDRLELQRLLDRVDARDSLAYLEHVGKELRAKLAASEAALAAARQLLTDPDRLVQHLAVLRPAAPAAEAPDRYSFETDSSAGRLAVECTRIDRDRTKVEWAFEGEPEMRRFVWVGPGGLKVITRAVQVEAMMVAQKLQAAPRG
jgi:phosphopantothenoylcysteine synthetase/decarboxylase